MHPHPPLRSSNEQPYLIEVTLATLGPSPYQSGTATPAQTAYMAALATAWQSSINYCQQQMSPTTGMFAAGYFDPVTGQSDPSTTATNKWAALLPVYQAELAWITAYARSGAGAAGPLPNGTR